MWKNDPGLNLIVLVPFNIFGSWNSISLMLIQRASEGWLVLWDWNDLVLMQLSLSMPLSLSALIQSPMLRSIFHEGKIGMTDENHFASFKNIELTKLKFSKLKSGDNLCKEATKCDSLSSPIFSWSERLMIFRVCRDCA